MNRVQNASGTGVILGSWGQQQWRKGPQPQAEHTPEAPLRTNTKPPPDITARMARFFLMTNDIRGVLTRCHEQRLRVFNTCCVSAPGLAGTEEGTYEPCPQ